MNLKGIGRKLHLDVDGKIILKLIFKKVGGGGMDWIDLAEDRNRWWAPANAVMKFQVPYNEGNFLTS